MRKEMEVIEDEFDEYDYQTRYIEEEIRLLKIEIEKLNQQNEQEHESKESPTRAK